MMQMTASDYCIELESRLEFLEECVHKLFGIDQNKPLVKLPNLSFMDDEVETINDIIWKFNVLTIGGLVDSSTSKQISKLCKRTRKILHRYEEGKFFVLSFWDHTKSECKEDGKDV